MMVFKDDVYFGKDMVQFSLIPLEGYMKWSEFIATKMSGFRFNSQYQIENVTAPVFNYQLLMKIFTNKDPNALIEETKLFE